MTFSRLWFYEKRKDALSLSLALICVFLSSLRGAKLRHQHPFWRYCNSFWNMDARTSDANCAFPSECYVSNVPRNWYLRFILRFLVYPQRTAFLFLIFANDGALYFGVFYIDLIVCYFVSLPFTSPVVAPFHIFSLINLILIYLGVFYI